jgi:hypothetical protein
LVECVRAIHELKLLLKGGFSRFSLAQQEELGKERKYENKMRRGMV